MARKPKPSDQSGASFEKSLEELESIIARIESGDVGLERSIGEYERGVELIRRCRAILEQAEQRIEQLNLSELEAAVGSSGDGPEDDEGDDDAEESPF